MELTCFDVLDPPLYLSSAFFPQPNGVKEMKKSNLVLKRLGIKTIINMSSDSRSRKEHREFYQEMGISLFEKPIDDVGGFIKNDILDSIVKIYQTNKENGSVLIHCSLGINRSAFVAGAILWSQKGEKEWKTPDLMIDWMKKCQIRDRKLSSLLENGWMKMSLIRWCHDRDGTNVSVRTRKRS